MIISNLLTRVPVLLRVLIAALGLPFTVGIAHAVTDGLPGMVGIGTWGSEVEFKDFKVTKNGELLYESDFRKGMEGWKTFRGRWEVIDGALRQTSTEADCRALIGDPGWIDCTITLKARKIAGDEGFLVLFGYPAADADFKSWLNLGGWGNSHHALQSPNIFEKRTPGRIETGRWYEAKVELSGDNVRAYLDGQLVQSARLPSVAGAQRNLGNALIPDLVADPSIFEVGGMFYCYATTDGMGQGLATAGLPVVWKSRDFLNWSFSGSIFPAGFDLKYWAPSAPVKKDGRYYLFPTLNNRITAVVADSPEGPFYLPNGGEINSRSGWKTFPITVGHPIDADIFKDDDGSFYMSWSERFMAKLNQDFTAFDGEPFKVRTKRGGYSEGPVILKRGEVYYYLYTLGGSESYQYAYMMSRHSVRGPWEAPDRDIIATTNREAGVFGPGHGTFFNPAGSSRWFFVHLEYGRSGTNRHVMAAEMQFNADGTIEPIQLSLDGVGALRPDPAYAATNLALGAKVSASSTRADVRIKPIADPLLNRIETFSPSNAIDASNGSRWMARDGDEAVWLQIDLGKIHPLSRTEIYFVTPTKGHAYLLETSLDGQNWKRAGGHEDVRIQSPHVDKQLGEVRYLRVQIRRGAPGIWEFRVY